MEKVEEKLEELVVKKSKKNNIREVSYKGNDFYDFLGINGKNEI
jgi:hypothetical protein